MRKYGVAAVGILLLLAFFGADIVYSKEKPTKEDAERIAAVTCAIIKETRKIDSAIRVEKVNEARQKLGAPPFLDGDDEIVRAIKWGTCELLILDSETMSRSL